MVAQKTTRSTRHESTSSSRTTSRAGTAPPPATVPSTRTSKRLAVETDISGAGDGTDYSPDATTKPTPSITSPARTSQRSTGKGTSRQTAVSVANETKKSPQRKTVERKRDSKAKTGSAAAVVEIENDLDAEDAGDHARQPEFVGPTDITSDESETEVSKLKHVSWMYPHLLGKWPGFRKRQGMELIFKLFKVLITHYLIG